MLGAHADSPQELPLLFAEDAVNLTHGREVKLVCAPMRKQANQFPADGGQAYRRKIRATTNGLSWVNTRGPYNKSVTLITVNTFKLYS